MCAQQGDDQPMKTSRLRTASAIFVTLAATTAAVPAFSGTSVAAAAFGLRRSSAGRFQRGRIRGHVRLGARRDRVRPQEGGVPGRLPGRREGHRPGPAPGDQPEHLRRPRLGRGQRPLRRGNARRHRPRRLHGPAGLGRQRPADHPVRRHERPRHPGRRVPGPGVRAGRLRRRRPDGRGLDRPHRMGGEDRPGREHRRGRLGRQHPHGAHHAAASPSTRACRPWT